MRLNFLGLWASYLTVAARSLAKHKTYTFINLVGLALGLAASLIILIYVRYETSYDARLPGAERAFQLQQWNTGNGPNEEPGGTQMTSYVSGQRLREFPQLDRVVYVGNGQPVILQNGEATVSEDFVYVDGPLFDILQIPFLRGDRATALAAPASLVLTESEAVRRFGSIDAVGRTLTLVARGQTADYRVTGVIQDPPRNSHLALSIAARADIESLYGAGNAFLTQWMPKNGWVYARLRPGADVTEIARQMPAWERRNIPDQMLGRERFNPGTNVDWRLLNVRDIHLGEAQGSGMRPGNDRTTVAAMALVGVLILAMAVVNFVNLATARAGQRAREVALRKVLGASRRQLIGQFLGESVLLTSVAMLIALTLVEAALPFVNAFLGADLAVTYFSADGILLPALLLILLVGGLGGLYPAFYLSRFQPARVLKANKSAAADTEGSGRLRNALVVGQFAVSIGLIICTAIIQAQTDYARTADPGYRRDGILQIGQMNRSALAPRLENLMREIAGVDGVVSAGRSTIGVDTWGMENMTVTARGASESVEFELYRVDPGFFPTLGIDRLAGRTFVEGRAMDDSTVDSGDDAAVGALARRGYNVVINALAARRLGFSDPRQAVGRTVLADDGDVETVGRTPITIIGVVENSRFRSIRDPEAPMIFLYNRLAPSWLLVRYNGVPIAVRDRLERVWKSIAPDVPFEAEFADDIVSDLYQPEASRARLFAAFSFLAVVIGCLGLFGLAAFTAERRTKEIGIRKVLGARTRDIVRLLVWQFSRLVLVANLIAWPFAWWIMRDWLNGFDLRIALDPLLFVAAGALAFVIAAATVTSHALRVARTHPVQALRYE